MDNNINVVAALDIHMLNMADVNMKPKTNPKAFCTADIFQPDFGFRRCVILKSQSAQEEQETIQFIDSRGWRDR